MKIVFFILASSGLLFLPMCKQPTPPDNCPTPLDTTSHSIQWQVDTLGAQGLIRDVWVFSKTNAWAVGEIYLKDSAGNIDQGNPYNAARWDGVKWNLIKIQFYVFCNQPDTIASPAYAIWAFSPQDIWIASYTEVARHNGTAQTSITCLPVSVNKMWGTSSGLIFTAGVSGQIGFWNGNTWTKLASGTTVDLEDIWGIEASNKYFTINFVWATGTTVSDGRCVVLQYNGTAWSTIYNNAGQPNQNYFHFSSVWTKDASTLYLAGGSRLRKMALSNSTFSDEMATGQTYAAYKIRATKPSDFFVTAAGGELAHYNGVSWYLYPELKAYNNSSAFVLFYTVHPTSDFVVVGGEFFTGLNGFPVVVRGYR